MKDTFNRVGAIAGWENEGGRWSRLFQGTATRWPIFGIARPFAAHGQTNVAGLRCGAPI